MDNPNPIRYSDLITPDNSIEQLIAQLEALISKYEDLRSRVQTAAAETAKEMKGLSGATEEQRQTILKSTEASDKLLAEYQKFNDELLEAKKNQAQLNAANREATQIAKLLEQLNRSKEGSYNRLSAQYRLNKIALNEMSEAERKTTDFGKQLETETKAIYEEMNRLQKATGMSQLQVGQYERALGSALGVKGKFLSVLTDTNKASETFKGILNTLKTPLGAIIGLVGAAVAAFKLFKDSIHETQQTGDALDYEVAGWTNTWDLFKKSISTVDFSIFIRNAAEAARAGKELKMVLDEMFERTASTRLMKAAMSQQNAVLEETMRNTQLSYDERIAAGEQYLENMQPIYDQEVESTKRVRDAQIENLFALTKTREYASNEEREAAKQEFADNIKNYNLNEDLIKQAKEYQAALKQQSSLERLIAQYQTQGAKDPRVIESLNRQKAAQDAIVQSTSDAAKSFTGFIEQYRLTNDEQVKAYVDAEVAYNEAQAAVYNDQKRFINSLNSLRNQAANEQRTNAQNAAKEAERIAKEQQAAEKARLDAEAKDAAERERIRKEEINQQKQYLQAQLQSVQLQIAVTEKGTQTYLNYQIEAIEKQRAIAIFENAQLAEKLRQDEAAINAKYDAEILRTTADFNTQLAQRDLAAFQDRAQAEFELMDWNERQKTVFRLEQEKARLEAILEINKTAAEKMTADEILAIQATIEGIKKEIGRTGYSNLYELLGLNLDSKQQSALNTALGTVKDSLGGLADSWKATADAAKKAADDQVSAAQKILDAQIEARNEGYANEVETARKELALAQKNREKALKEQEKAQRAQNALDSLNQASSLVTASANLWKSFSGLGAVGVAAALAAIAGMWVSFAGAKIKAAQVTKYGEGTVELLEGGSHASGHDIDLGTRPDGTRRRAEGGEFFAVINKRNSRRFRNVIPDVINSLNDGSFADRYQRASASMAGVAVGMIGTDVTGLERDVAAIRKQGDETRYIDGEGNTVIRYKNLTRKIKS